MKSTQAQTKHEGRKRIGKRVFLLASCSLIFLAFLSGCGNKFWDPGQVGRFRPVPAVNVILDSLGVAEETPLAWEQGEDPRPSDTVVMETDYVFRSGDIVRVSIFELLQEGVQVSSEYVVTETGKISIPDVGVVEAAGLTETQLEEEIRQILSPSILKEPSVVVTLIASQQRTFSVLGVGVPAPGRYVIPRYDFRLKDALATAGGQRQFNVSYIYVSRSAGDEGLVPGSIVPELDLQLIEPEMRVPGVEEQKGSEQEMLEIIAPRVQRHQWPASKVVMTSSELATETELGQPILPGTFDTVGADEQGLRQKSPTAMDSGVSAGLDMWQESGDDEQISVQDILKTLAERSRNGTTEDEPGKAMDPLKPTTPTVRSRTMELPARDVPTTDVLGGGAAEAAVPTNNEAVNLDEVMRSLSKRPRQKEVVGQRIGVGGAVRPSRPTVPAGGQMARNPIGVDDILKSLEERPGRAIAEEPTGWDDVLKSFAEPGPGQEKVDEEMDLDELLKSFAEPGERERVDEQIEVGDVGIDIVPSRVEPSAVGVEQDNGRIEWVFQDGKWVPMQIGPPMLTKPVIKVEPPEYITVPAEEQPTGGLEWTTGEKSRLIKIPAEKLMSGDPRYNIVIKPGDCIYVPVDVIGEFCIMGNVNHQGYIPITGRPLTLKMAIAAAGGLGPLAYPKRCEVTRRIGRKKEEIVMVDLDKIASGELPDFFIKPNDLINVGTHATSRWRAVLRNAFRATYGFGFVYDRNFALDNYYKSYGRTTRVDISEAVKIF